MNLHDLDWDDRFDRDYYENGIKTGKSLYENYCWHPEISMPIAYKLKSMFPDQRILDFGCAKGFLVRALRSIGVKAYGFEVSKYAVINCDEKAIFFIAFPGLKRYPKVDIVYTKDVLEHFEYDEIDDVLRMLWGLCRQAFMIIPFGDNGKYRIPDYHKDTSHIIAENEDWWLKKFDRAGFAGCRFDYKWGNLKRNWKDYPKGNGFFRLWRSQ